MELGRSSSRKPTKITNLSMDINQSVGIEAMMPLVHDVESTSIFDLR